MNTEEQTDLAAGVETPPKRRGRPPGSKNKQAEFEEEYARKMAELDELLERARTQVEETSVFTRVEDTGKPGKRLGTHPEDPIATGRIRILVSDSPSLTVILRPTIEGLDGSGGKYAKYPGLKVQFDQCRAAVDEALLPLLHNHPSWNAQSGGVFDPMDPGAPRGRRSGPQVVEGVATGIRPESDMEPLPRWDTRDVDELVEAINNGTVHHMDVINWEGRPSGRKRPAVLEAATQRLMTTASKPDEAPLESFSAQIPGEA